MSEFVEKLLPEVVELRMSENRSLRNELLCFANLRVVARCPENDTQSLESGFIVQSFTGAGWESLAKLQNRMVGSMRL